MVAGGWPPSLSKSVIALLPGADNWTPLASLPGGPAQGAAPGIVAGRIQLTVASEVTYDDPDIKWLMYCTSTRQIHTFNHLTLNDRAQNQNQN